MIASLHRREFLKRVGFGTGALALAARDGPALAGTSRGSSRSEGLVAFRISAEQWMTDVRFDDLLAFFARRPGVADELAFFTSGTHPPLPLDEICRRAERLATLMPRVRQEGMAAGINLLATMGHHEENLDGSLNPPWQRVTDPHGRESRGSFCPASEELLGYVQEVYTALAGVGSVGPLRLDRGQTGRSASSGCA